MSQTALEKQGPISGIYQQIQTQCVSAADGPLRNTFGEHAVGGMALIAGLMATTYSKMGW